MKLTLLLVLLLNGLSVQGEEPTSVRVGMYPFAPFVEEGENSSTQGMSIDLMSALNRIQTTYLFEPVMIPPKRRYQSYQDEHYDIIFYESKAWGWDDIHIEESKVYQSGGEVYVALNKPGRTQAYFDSFDNKRIIGITGFHYGFAEFNANENFLAEQFNMILTENNTRNFNLLLKGRGDISVVTKAYLKRYLLDHPEHKDQLLISKRLDQEYQHTILVRPNIRPSVSEINALLDTLKQKGEMNKLLSKYGFKTQ